MKSAVLYSPGDPEHLVLEERTIPEAGEGQVLVRVRSFGLNRSELMTRKGLSPSVKFPRVLGIECVGEVVWDPSGEYTEGQKVMAYMGEMGRQFDGSYSEYAVLPKGIIYPFESWLPWEILGAIPEMFQTAHGSLFAALDIQPGETLLVRGGTSSVGMLAIQLARKHGLTVVATTRNKNRVNMLHDLGAARVVIDDGTIREKVRSIYAKGVDKALELVGTDTLKDTLQCIRFGGTTCMTGMLSENWTVRNFIPMDFIPGTVRLTTYDSGEIRSPAEAFQGFIDGIESGEFRLKIGKVFKLNQIVEAHKLMESNQAGGKIVVVV